MPKILSWMRRHPSDTCMIVILPVAGWAIYQDARHTAWPASVMAAEALGFGVGWLMVNKIISPVFVLFDQVAAGLFNLRSR